jgi:hypothetical protein
MPGDPRSAEQTLSAPDIMGGNRMLKGFDPSSQHVEHDGDEDEGQCGVTRMPLSVLLS